MKKYFYILIVSVLLVFMASCSKYEPLTPVKSKNAIQSNKSLQATENLLGNKPITDPENEEDVNDGVSITDPENEEDKFSN